MNPNGQVSPLGPPRHGALFAVGTGALAVGTAVAAVASTSASPFDWLGLVAMISGGSAAAAGWLLLRGATRASAATSAENVQLRLQLHQLQLRAQELPAAQGRFVGNIAHELKTPLAIVLNQAELLQSCSEDPIAVRRHAKGIGEDMRHLSHLIESFLRLARPFAQEDRSQHEPVYFHDCVVEAVRRSQSLARDCRVSVVTKLAEGVDGDAAVEVLGDPMLLGAMVENLLRNAIRFSPRGAAVDVVVEARPGTSVLVVRDRGTGIPAEHLASVFDWFFDPSSDAKRSAGTGFGLAIARRVAEHHGGTIALRNRADGGCEFEVQLPTCSEPQVMPTTETPPAARAV